MSTHNLPPPYRWLGEALQPIALELSAYPRATAAPATAFSIEAHLDHTQYVLAMLESGVADLAAATLNNPLATRDAVFIAAGRFQSVLREIARLPDNALAIDLPPDFPHASRVRTLLIDAHRHTLNETAEWLSDLVSLLVDPETALRRRGLATSGTIDITLALTLTASPQMTELSALLEASGTLGKHAPARYRQAGAGSARGRGVWDTVFAVALGIGIGEALFGDDDSDI